MTAAAGFGVALVVTLVAAPLVLLLVRRLGVLDHPTGRSSHATPTPRSGGIAVFVGLAAGLATSTAIGGSIGVALAIATTGFAAIGLADDVLGLAPRARLAAQAAISVLSLPWLLDGLHGITAWQVLFVVGCWCWLIAFVNAFNFMDGINGISVAGAALAGAAFWIIGNEGGAGGALSVMGAVLAGAALGFGPFNFPSARMFLGDVGSYALGAWIAVIVVTALRADLGPVAAFGPVAISLTDTAWTLVRRARRHEHLLDAHHDHTYQQLVDLGWSHPRTTALVALAISACCAAAVVAAGERAALQIAGGTWVVAVCAAYVCLPAAVTRRRARA